MARAASLSRLFLGGQLAFQVGAVGDRVLQRVLGRLQGRRQLRLLLADPGGLALQVLGVAAPALLGGRLGGAADPRVGQRDRAADPLGQLRQLVPGLLGALEPGREAAHLALQLGLAGERRPQLGLGRVLALLQLRLVGDLVAQRVPQGHQVVREEPEPGVAQVGLDDGGPAGDGGLPAERLELAAQFVGEVLDPGQVGAHRVQLPQRLLFPLAVLQDMRRPPR